MTDSVNEDALRDGRIFDIQPMIVGEIDASYGVKSRE
jgi:hypothetical protein